MDSRLAVFALGAFAGSMEASVLPGLLPMIGAETGLSPAIAGYVVFVYSLTYAVSGPLLATLLGSGDRRRVVAAGEVALALCALAIALAPNFVVIVLARGLLAASAVTFTSMAQATVVMMTPGERRGRALSVMLVGSTLAVAFGAPLAALVALNTGWRPIYGAIAVIAALASATLFLRLPRGLVGERRPLRERLAVLALPGISRALLVNVLYTAGTYFVLIYLATVTTQSMRLGSGTVPFVLLANGIGSIAGGTGSGHLVDAFGPRRTVLLQIVLTIAILLAISLTPMLPAFAVLPAWLVLMALLGITTWVVYAGQLALVAALAPNAVPLVISLNLSSANIGAAGGALLGGMVLTHLGAGALGIAGALLVALSWVAMRSARTLVVTA